MFDRAQRADTDCQEWTAFNHGKTFGGFGVPINKTNVLTNLFHIVPGPLRDTRNRQNQKKLQKQHPNKFGDENQTFQQKTGQK